MQEGDNRLNNDFLGKDSDVQSNNGLKPDELRASSPKKRVIKLISKVVLSIVGILFLLPIIIYIPPVQTFLKNVACSVASDATGMQISIGRFGLAFPLDIALDDVVVIEASGDTMVRAKEVIVDLKLRPLFNKEISPDRLSLKEAMFRMVLPDSSMMLKAKLNLLTIGPSSRFNLGYNLIDIDDAKIDGGRIELLMALDNAKPTQEDTTSQKMLIRARYLEMHNVGFGMSMLPAIDTLDMMMGKTILREGVIDLNTNKISAKYLGTEKGNLTYLTPSTVSASIDSIAKDSTTSKSKPMIIVADSVALIDYRLLYAKNGVKPQRGFDASYIKADSVSLTMSNFYMEGSDINLPIRTMEARERCGLNLLSGRGTISISEKGLRVKDFDVKTNYSQIYVDADINYSLISMQKDAPIDIIADANIGFVDVYNFMPELENIFKGIPTYNPLQLDLQVYGSLSDVKLDNLNLAIKDYLSMSANGRVRNIPDIRRMNGAIELRGELKNTSLVNRIVYDSGMQVPALTIAGNLVAERGVYQADLDMLTEQGDVLFDGRLEYNREKYYADIALNSFQMQSVMPSLGIGSVTASVNAEGCGFNPMISTTWADAVVNIEEIEYGNHKYGEIESGIKLKEGNYDVQLISYDPYADVDLYAIGQMSKDIYSIEARLNVNHLDLNKLGFSKNVNSGQGVISLKGKVYMSEKEYEADLNISSVEWSLPGRLIHLPKGLSMHFDSDKDNVNLAMIAPNVNASFDSQCGLDSLVNQLTLASDTLMKQIDKKRLSIDDVRRYVPPFGLSLKASGKGLVGQMLSIAGIGVDSVDIKLSKSDNLTLNGLVRKLDVGSILLDTLTLQMKDRGRVIDYRLHMGNRRGNLDEFSKVDLNGYLGGNRASASLTQKNVAGDIGYRLGLTAAIQDSIVSLHFTPLNATIAYMPWVLNEDNHVDYNFSSGHIDANFTASSNDSHIKLNTIPDEEGNALNVNIANLKIEDFLRLYALAPPIKGSVNSDMKLIFRENVIGGKGSLGVVSLAYERQRIGDLDFEFSAGMGNKGKSGAKVSLLLDKQKVLTGYGIVNSSDSISGTETKMGLKLTEFPLKIANAFLGKDVASLSGALNGDMTMIGSIAQPILNGKINFKDASVYLPIMGSSLRLDTAAVSVNNNIIMVDSFDVWGANKNPMTLKGKVDARSFSDIGIDLLMNAQEMLVVNNDKRAKSDIYGKLYMTMSASAKGNLAALDIIANASILPATDIYYTIPETQAMMMEKNSSEVVRFVQLADTTKKVVVDSIPTSTAMRINANLNIVNGAQATVNLSANGADRAQIQPSGTLIYSQSYMGDMRLNGQLNLESGVVRYTPPIMGEKVFAIQPGSYVLWNGELMNPILNIKAVNNMKASVKQDGQNSRIVNFDITLDITNTLSNMGIKFDVSTDDDATVQNELKSMSDDQRSNQAMNMLITNAYAGGVAKSASDIGENALYSFLSSQLNSWAASNIRGVDLSFGIDQYDKTVDGRNSSSMSYSYQLSKSLFDNKFKIVVGGNYTTDASADENFAQNLISDISFEYTLKQTNTLSMYLKLFRHTGYESILEGEITETGAGFVMKRRLLSLKHLFRSHGKKKTSDNDSIKKDSINQSKVIMTPDSILGDELPETEGYDVLN